MTAGAATTSAVHLLLRDPKAFLRRLVRSHTSLLRTHSLLLTSGLLFSPVHSGLLLCLSSSLSPLSHFLLLFRNLPSPIPTFSLNSLLHSVTLVSPPSVCIPFFSSLLSLSPPLAPNPFTLVPLISCCARARKLSTGVQLHAQSVRRGIISSFHFSNALVHFYSSCGQLDTARKLFDEMPYKDIVSYNTLVDACASHGDLDGASEVFDKMGKRNVVSWNILINGLVKSGHPWKALELFKEMKRIKGLKGTAVTMVSVVTACARLGRVHSGKEVHAYFLRNFEENNLVLWTALVDMYSKCRRVDIAQKVFDKIANSERNLVCWNAMIAGQCVYGDPIDGLKLFHDLVGKGGGLDNGEKTQKIMSPDEVTFAAVLCACARAGLLNEGTKHFKQMIETYKLKPKFAHYWCMANLYASQGLTEKAETVLKYMPEKTWTWAVASLLGLCRFRGESELVERIAKRLIELEPRNGTYRALLCNVYVATGRWKDAKKVKKETEVLMRRERYSVGHRLVDLNQIMHNFSVQDGAGNRPELLKEIFVILDELAVKFSLVKGKE